MTPYNRRDIIELHLSENAKDNKERFWYQDLILRVIQNNNLEKGCLFYHGMGTGKHACIQNTYETLF